MSVGFADKDETVQFYQENGYVVDETEVGRAYYPAENVRITGEICVRYEVFPWISRFEIDGIRPVPTLPMDYRDPAKA